MRAEISRRAKALGLMVLLSLGLLATCQPPASADPPPWAPAHGWRRKHEGWRWGYRSWRWRDRDYRERR